MAIVLSNPTSADNFVGYGGVKPVITTAAATSYTLTTMQSGSLVRVTGGGETSTITLPTPVGNAGCDFDFVLSGDNTAIIGIVSPVAATVAGRVIVSAANEAKGAGAVGTAASVRVNLTATALDGDFVHVVSTGAKWIVSGQSYAAAGLAFA